MARDLENLDPGRQETKRDAFLPDRPNHGGWDDSAEFPVAPVESSVLCLSRVEHQTLSVGTLASCSRRPTPGWCEYLPSV